MNVTEFERFCAEAFGPQLLSRFADEGEYGFTYRTDKDIVKVGYCVNLTPETVAEPIRHGVGLMVTHHDAWDFLYGMRDACRNLLRRHSISHYYVHLPLDYANFGTCSS